MKLLELSSHHYCKTIRFKNQRPWKLVDLPEYIKSEIYLKTQVYHAFFLWENLQFLVFTLF